VLSLIEKYFPSLSASQRDQFTALGPLYAEWNERVNLVSRKDMEHLYERHILHSLGIAAVYPFPAGARVVDVGTGGGFPLVPLAILFPQSTFHGIDGIGKKINAVNGVIHSLGLTNCTAEQVRSEDHKQKYDYIVSRAVTTLPEFIRMTKHLIDPKSLYKAGTRSPLQSSSPSNGGGERGGGRRAAGGEGVLKAGILYLKGGELADEILPLKQRVRVYELKEIFDEEFFTTKKVVHVVL
jgi:16S rRNA (guanine527-N7)-methyltransferase